MELPAVTPETVAEFAPGAPIVSTEQVAEALDWAEGLYVQAGILPPAEATLQGRELRRAIMAYALSLAPAAVAYAAGLDSGRISKLKDGDQEITFQTSDAGSIAAAGAGYESSAFYHLRRAGYPFPNWAAGASA